MRDYEEINKEYLQYQNLKNQIENFEENMSPEVAFKIITEEEVRKSFPESLCLKAIEHNPQAVSNIKNPTEIAQLKAIEQAPWIIQYIENPTEKAQRLAIEKDEHNIEYIKNPVKDLLEQDNPKDIERHRLELIEASPNMVLGLDEPSEAEIKKSLELEPNLIQKFPEELQTEEWREFAIRKDPTVIQGLGSLSEQEKNIVAKDESIPVDFVLNELLVKRKGERLSEKTFGYLVDREPDTVLVLNEPSENLLEKALKNERCSENIKEKIETKFEAILPKKMTPEETKAFNKMKEIRREQFRRTAGTNKIKTKGKTR